jgi:hypothetical protein
MNRPNAYRLYLDGKTTENVATVMGVITFAYFIVFINFIHLLSSYGDRLVVLLMVFWFIGVTMVLAAKGASMKATANYNYGTDGEEYW